MKTCNTCGESKLLNDFRKYKLADGGIGYRKRCNSCIHKIHWQWAKQNPINIMLQSAKHRAKRDGLPFSLKSSDIIIPDVCPVLGYKLVAGDRHNHDFAPTIDRIKPELGYVPGNIIIVSYRANRIKNDATMEELMKILSFYQRSIVASAASYVAEDHKEWDSLRRRPQ